MCSKNYRIMKRRVCSAVPGFPSGGRRHFASSGKGSRTRTGTFTSSTLLQCAAFRVSAVSTENRVFFLSFAFKNFLFHLNSGNKHIVSY